MAILAFKMVGMEGSGISHRYTVTYHVYATEPPSIDDAYDIDLFFRAQSVLPDWGERFKQNGEEVEAFCTDVRSRWLQIVQTNEPDNLAVGVNNGTIPYHLWESVAEYNPVGDFRLDHRFNHLTQTNGGPIQRLEFFPYYFQPRYRFAFGRRRVDRLFGEFKGTFPFPTSNSLPFDTRIAPASQPGLPNPGTAWEDSGERGAIQNTARVQYDPPAQGTEADLVIRVRNYSVTSYTGDGDGFGTSYPYGGGSYRSPPPQGHPSYIFSPAAMYAAWIGRVNRVKISHYDPEAGIGVFKGVATPDRQVWDAYTMKLESLTSNMIRLNGGWVYENDWEWHYRRGLKVLDSAGGSLLGYTGWLDLAPDLSRYERNDQTGADQPCLKQIVIADPRDPDNRILAYDPVRLDGTGAVLVNEGSNCDQSFWNAWMTEYTADFYWLNEPGKAAIFRWDDTIDDDYTQEPWSDPDSDPPPPP